jgi:hypothetical protein
MEKVLDCAYFFKNQLITHIILIMVMGVMLHRPVFAGGSMVSYLGDPTYSHFIPSMTAQIAHCSRLVESGSYDFSSFCNKAHSLNQSLPPVLNIRFEP